MGTAITIVLLLFVFSTTSAVDQCLQCRPIGLWRSYAYGERAYPVRSLVAESALVVGHRSWVLRLRHDSAGPV